ncbi:MAG: thiamine pyrophosphate-binding protein [Candidatus Saganbacteria bacterium]|nr:thiamine pyrophosphate-binding protein [Candidatus Saganbacteria bacterium]
MIKVSDYIMNFLVSRGITMVYMLPGGGAIHLVDSLGRCPKLKYTCFFHEQALAIAVEAHGQHLNSPGVGLVTSGPGSTNTITAVAAAYIDSTPCVFISGQAKRSDLKGKSGVRQMGSQEVDIISMVSCITKYAVTIMEPGEVRFHLEKAWHEATTGRMGPVWLDIPLDVQGAMVDENVLQGYVKPAPPEPKLPLDRIVAALERSKRPLILVGNGVKLSGASAAVRNFAEKHRVPMVLTWKTADFLGYDHPLNFGFPGILGSRYANFIVQTCDLLLVLGSRLDPSLTAFNSRDFGRNASKIMIDIDAAEINKIENVDLRVIADVKTAVSALTELTIKLPDHAEWLAHCARLKKRYPEVNDGAEPADGVDLYRFTAELCRQLKPDDIIVPESSGAAGEVTYQALRVKFGQSVKNAAGLGSMGFGLPYAIGSCLALGGRRTVLINGDGAFQLNLQELETVRRLRLPLKMFILDNGGYASIANTQRNMFNGFIVGADASSGFTLPDICAVARAYKLRPAEIMSGQDLKTGIAEVLTGAEPVLCRLKVRSDQPVMPRVRAMKLPGGGMASKPLEEMWPDLPAEELEENMAVSKDD